MRPVPLLLLMPMVLAAGCHRAAVPETDLDAAQEAPADYVQLLIENHNWADVVISVEHGGQRSRLGLAKAASSSQMRIPVGWTGAGTTIRLVAHRVGSPTEFRSEPFVVLSEQDITWTLETNLESSSLSLR